MGAAVTVYVAFSVLAMMNVITGPSGCPNGFSSRCRSESSDWGSADWAEKIVFVFFVFLFIRRLRIGLDEVDRVRKMCFCKEEDVCLLA